MDLVQTKYGWFLMINTSVLVVLSSTIYSLIYLKKLWIWNYRNRQTRKKFSNRECFVQSWNREQKSERGWWKIIHIFTQQNLGIQYQNLGIQYTVDDVHIDLTISPVFSSWDRANGCSSPCQFSFLYLYTAQFRYTVYCRHSHGFDYRFGFFQCFFPNKWWIA